MVTRRDRARGLLTLDGITRHIFCQRTGYSPDQFHSWFGTGARVSPPSVLQMEKICEVFDWSPTYIVFGVGEKRLSEIVELREAIAAALANNKMLIEMLEILKKTV